jgi:hypothetical protein
MQKDEAFALLLETLKDVLPDVETYAKHAKNIPAKKAALARAQRIRQVLELVKDV